MSLEQVIKRRIETLKANQLKLEPHELQRWGNMEDQIEMLLGLLEAATAPVVEQQVNVRLTLSVDVSISKQNIKERILSYLGQSDGITTMSIEIEEEAEIYNNG